MATSRICSILDCGKPHYARSWCKSHYTRWMRYGSPTGLKGRPRKLESYIKDEVLPYSGDDCLIWPFTRSRSGYAMWGSTVVSRYVCEAANGPPPTPKYDAAHSCGKGNLGCVAKRHLSWKTHAENMADTIIHGTSPRGIKHGHAKLTEADVRSIRAMKGKVSQRKMAKQFGITQTTVSRALSGKRWGWLDSQTAG